MILPYSATNAAYTSIWVPLPPVHFPEMGDAPLPGGMGIRLADDMHTLTGEPFLCANGIETCKGTSYETHPFFEASSIRHYIGRLVLSYLFQLAGA